MALYNKSLTDAEIAANAGAGPPSFRPTASAQTVTTTTDENVNVTIVLPSTDPDQVIASRAGTELQLILFLAATCAQAIGWDLTLSARIVSLTFSTPVTGIFTTAGTLHNQDGTEISTSGGACLTLNATGYVRRA